MDFADRQNWQVLIEGAERDGEIKEHSEFSALVGWVADIKLIFVFVRLLCMTRQKPLDVHFGVDLNYYNTNNFFTSMHKFKET